MYRYENNAINSHFSSVIHLASSRFYSDAISSYSLRKRVHRIRFGSITLEIVYSNNYGYILYNYQ